MRLQEALHLSKPLPETLVPLTEGHTGFGRAAGGFCSRVRPSRPSQGFIFHSGGTGQPDEGPLFYGDLQDLLSLPGVTASKYWSATAVRTRGGRPSRWARRGPEGGESAPPRAIGKVALAPR